MKSRAYTSSKIRELCHINLLQRHQEDKYGQKYFVPICDSDAALCKYQLVQSLGYFLHQTLHMTDVESINLVVQDGGNWTFSMNGELLVEDWADIQRIRSHLYRLLEICVDTS